MKDRQKGRTPDAATVKAAAAVRFVADHLCITPAGKPKAANGRPRIIATYDYRDAAGNLAYQAVRFKRAELLQWIQDGCPRVDGGQDR